MKQMIAVVCFGFLLLAIISILLFGCAVSTVSGIPAPGGKEATFSTRYLWQNRDMSYTVEEYDAKSGKLIKRCRVSFGNTNQPLTDALDTINQLAPLATAAIAGGTVIPTP